jgi:hypothetical protein
VGAVIVEKSHEIVQLVFEIRRCPEQGAIQELASNGSNQPFQLRLMEFLARTGGNALPQ